MSIKNYTNEKGFAPLFLILSLVLISSLGVSAASKINQTTDYPQTKIALNSAVLGDHSAEQIKSEEEYRKLKELKMAELRLTEELKYKEKATREAELKKQKEEWKLKEEKTRLEYERKKELIKKQNDLRMKAKQNQASKEAELEQNELRDLEKELQLLESELKGQPDDRVVYEQTIGDLKLKYKYENGKLAVKAQAENGAEIDVDDPQVNLVKEQLEKSLKSGSGMGIATASGKTLIGKNKIKAWANGVVTVDPTTNIITISTGKGQKQVSVLPEDAVNNLFSRKILSEVEYDQKLQDKSTGDSVIELQNRNDQAVYKVKGKKMHKILGLLEVKTDNTAFISAENGELVSNEESALAKFLALLSF